MLLAYLSALRRELVAFLMGSTPLALVGGFEHYRGQGIAWSLYAAALLCGFFVASYRVSVKARARSQKAEAGPLLRLSFDPSRPPYVYDFAGGLWIAGRSPVRSGPLQRLFRVCVESVGSETARDVRVVLDDVQPTPPELPLSHNLAFMHSASESALLHPNGKTWVDVVQAAPGSEAVMTFVLARHQRPHRGVACHITLRPRVADPSSMAATA